MDILRIEKNLIIIQKITIIIFCIYLQFFVSLNLFLQKLYFYSWFYYDFHYVLAEVNNNFLFIIYKTIIGIDTLIVNVLEIMILIIFYQEFSSNYPSLF